MTQDRFNYFSNKSKSELLKLTCLDFTVSELEEIIKEASLNDEDRKIAELKYIKDLKAPEIADKVFRDTRTIRSRISKISSKLHFTVVAIFLIRET